MRNFLFLSLGLTFTIIGLGSLGCGSTPDGPPHPHAGKVEYSKFQLRLDDVRAYKNESGLLVVDIDFYNRSVNGTPYRYQVFWKDANGGVISSADRSWRNITMNHGHHPLRLVAKNALAVDFRLTIVKDK